MDEEAARLKFLEKLLSKAKAGKSIETITLVSAPPEESFLLGRVLVLPLGEEPFGTLGDKLLTDRVVYFLSERQWEKPELFSLETDKKYLFFRDRVERPRECLVLGAGHISAPLVEVLACADYSVTVVDDRPDFAYVGRFPRADLVICGDFGEVLRSLVTSDFEAVIVVTRGHRSDLDCLRGLLQQRFNGYLGMIGSLRRVSEAKTRLKEEGFDSNILEALRAPIGLDLGAQTPAEIAVSIVAEMIGLRTGSSFLPLCAGSLRNG